MKFALKEKYGVYDLWDIMVLLRGENGCPWDRKQDHRSIRGNLIEETYEAVEAIDAGSPGMLCEELGDVLLQVVFHSCIEAEQGGFDLDDVADGICKKLILRHPHIFSDVVAETADEVLRNWDAIKEKEKNQTTKTDTLQSVPKVFPGLMRAAKVQSRAAKCGFDYPAGEDAFSEMEDEVAELWEAIQSEESARIQDELGDLLFSVVNVSRFWKIDAEQALGGATDKFIRRFEQVEQLAEKQGIDLKTCGIERLNLLWAQAKRSD